MNRLNCYFRPAAGLLLLVLGYAFLMPSIGRHTQASTTGNPIVTVGNTFTNPVPVVGSTTVSGTVSVSNTPNVNVTNVPNVSISNTPNVMLAGTPTVNLGAGSTVTVSGTPTVSLAGGSTVQPDAILDNLPNVVEEPSLDLGASKDYSFSRTVKTSCLIINTANTISIRLGVNPPNGVPYDVPMGPVFGPSGPLVINFTQPVPLYRVTVRNDSLVHATFLISAFGN